MRGKWTEGPWSFDRDEDGRGVIYIERGLCNHIAYLSNGGVDEVAEEANAHLIAAAPALYEALEALARALGKADVASLLVTELPAAWANIGDAMAKADAALTQARGEQQ